MKSNGRVHFSKLPDESSTSIISRLVPSHAAKKRFLNVIKIFQHFTQNVFMYIHVQPTN